MDTGTRERILSHKISCFHFFLILKCLHSQMFQSDVYFSKKVLLSFYNELLSYFINAGITITFLQ